MKSSAPDSIALTLDSISSKAVSMMTGTIRRELSCLMRRHNSKPSMHRHHHIGQDQVEIGLAQGGQGFFAVGGLDDVVGMHAQHGLDELQVAVVVVHDQNAGESPDGTAGFRFPI